MKAAWKKAPDFAEFAEALRVPTDQIVAAMVQPGSAIVHVIYSEQYVANVATHPDVFRQTLVRDPDGILRSDDHPIAMPGFWEQVEASVDDALAGIDDEGGVEED